METRIHLKGLNGIRGISVITVVISHASIQGSGFIISSGYPEYAVTFFFTLSGFLITYLLFSEKIKTGVSIKKFYIRRILRIWPLYFLYLAATLITIYIYDPGKLPGSLPWYLLFSANIPYIQHTTLHYVSHYWTLGTEEQFYLFWPWIIKGARNVLKALIFFTAGFFILKLIFRFIYFKWGDITPLYVSSVLRFECMSMGGIAALLCLQQHKLFLKITTHRITEIICWVCIVIMVMNKFHISPFFNHDLAALVAIGLMVNLSFNKKPLISLENRFCDLLGNLSYGIYIFHPLVIFYFGLLLEKCNVEGKVKGVMMYSGAVLITIGVAWLSYVFFEKKFLQLKDRFSPVKSSAAKYS